MSSGARGHVLPMDKYDMSLDVSISYRDRAIEYTVMLKNDSPHPIEPVLVYPAVEPHILAPDRESAMLGPLSGGQSASTTFILTPNEDFYDLVLSRSVLEGRDMDVRCTIRSRKGMITCEVHLKNRRNVPLEGVEVSPLCPPGYVSPLKSRVVDLAPLSTRKVSFNLVPERFSEEYEKRTARYVPFTPRVRRPAPPGPGDLPHGVHVEMDLPQPYARTRAYEPRAMCSSRSVRGLLVTPEIRETLRIEETTPEEIALTRVPRVKREIVPVEGKEATDEGVAVEMTAPEPEEEVPLERDEDEGHACPNCGGDLTFIDEYQRWYCYECERYA